MITKFPRGVYIAVFLLASGSWSSRHTIIDNNLNRLPSRKWDAASYKAQSSDSTGGYSRVCFLSNWAQYRPGVGTFTPADMDPFLCTHIVYGYIVINPDTYELELYEWNDDVSIEQLLELKASNPNLIITVSVGGWYFGSSIFSAMCQDEINMQHFAETAISFLRDLKVDGLDMNWEYPGLRGSPPDDKQQFTKLLQYIQNECVTEAASTGNKRLLLSATVAGYDNVISGGYEIPEICSLLDMVNVMTYDFHGAFDDNTGHNTPLHENTGPPATEHYNVYDAIIIWLEGGCPNHKVHMGLATYGRTFTLAEPDNDYGYNAEVSGPGNAGAYTRQNGFLAYYEICPLYNQSHIRIWNFEVNAPVLIMKDQWIAYDDEKSLTIKVDLLKNLGLGGAFVANADLDDFNAACGIKYILLKTIKEQLETGIVTTTTQITTTTSGEFSCRGLPDGLYSNPEDETTFYACSSGIPWLMECEPDLIWIDEKQECDWPSSTLRKYEINLYQRLKNEIKAKITK